MTSNRSMFSCWGGKTWALRIVCALDAHALSDGENHRTEHNVGKPRHPQHKPLNTISIVRSRMIRQTCPLDAKRR